jgi:hypothetical protein
MSDQENADRIGAQDSKPAVSGEDVKPETTPSQAVARVEKLLGHIARGLKPAMFVRDIERGDRAVFFRYFKGYRVDKISRARLEEILREQILEKKNDVLAALLIIHWNRDHHDLYSACKEHVQKINPDVEKVDRIEDSFAETMLADLLARFSREDILICVRFNEVRFSDAFIQSKIEV